MRKIILGCRCLNQINFVSLSMNNAYVYRHIRLDSDTVFYIGIGKGRNYERAKSNRSRNKHWNGVVNKYGYKVEIVFDNLTWEDACKREIEQINLYGRIDLGTGTLVNLCDGGWGGSVGRKVSEETRKKISDFHKGNTYTLGVKRSEETKEKLRIAFKGRIVSAETKQKLSKALKGRTIPEEQREKSSKGLIEYYKTHQNPMTGRTHTKEAREKIGLAQKGKIESAETIRKKADGHRGNKHTPETLEKMSIARKAYYANKKKQELSEE